MPIDVDPSSVSKLAGLLAGIRHLRLQGYRAPHRLRLLGRYGRRLAAMIRFFTAQPRGSCVVWTLSGDFVVPRAASLCGLPLVAVPMTFESLVPWSHDVLGGGDGWAKLRFEVEHIALAESVFCISAEEQWLLAGFGVPADLLPIYPAESLLRHLIALRARRLQTRQRHVLILSSSNPTNLTGLRHLIDLISGRIAGLLPPILLAGHGLERFREGIDPAVVAVEGTVNAERLDELMVSAKAILIYQHFGTGALTRIPESLAAGIPVVCNSLAARSARHYAGVYTFETADELAGLLRRDLGTPPVPRRPEEAEARLIAAVRRALAPKRGLP